MVLKNGIITNSSLLHPHSVHQKNPADSDNIHDVAMSPHSPHKHPVPGPRPTAAGASPRPSSSLWEHGWMALLLCSPPVPVLPYPPGKGLTTPVWPTSSYLTSLHSAVFWGFAFPPGLFLPQVSTRPAPEILQVCVQVSPHPHGFLWPASPKRSPLPLTPPSSVLFF